MSEDHIDQLRKGYAENDYLGEPADLGPLRAVTEREELAAAVAGLADACGRPLPADDPLAPLARDVACALVGAGFALHHCVQGHALYRLGGVCLLPVARGHDPNGKGGVVVSWTTHDLLSLDWERWIEYQGTQGIMNGALADVLDALGYDRCPFGLGGAWIVTGSRTGRSRAGR